MEALLGLWLFILIIIGTKIGRSHMENIPRRLMVIIFIILFIIIVTLGVLNYFAPKLGLERDSTITWIFVFLAGLIFRAVIPTKKDNEKDEDKKEVED